jgi:cyclic pyranopterin monophosphate synthase
MNQMAMPKPTFTHLDSQGRAAMVDIGDKPITAREAIAEGYITLQPATLAAITDGTVPKGEVLSTARIAGILAAKKCGELIPLCHPLPIESVSVDFDFKNEKIHITAAARITAKTGVEMEALTAVSIAALTIYDMCKAIDKTMSIDGIRLVKKTGGTKV